MSMCVCGRNGSHKVKNCRTCCLTRVQFGHLANFSRTTNCEDEPSTGMQCPLQVVYF